jgi:chaperonin GroEL (HSP60 family)
MSGDDVRRAPCRLIADNAGIEGEVIVQALKGKSFEMGYNAMDDKVEDLYAAGIIDPAKVPPDHHCC